MYKYNIQHLKTVLGEILRENISPEANSWLNEKLSTLNGAQFNTIFVTLPRKTGKSIAKIKTEQSQLLSTIRSQLSVKDWTVDRIARVWLLLHLDATDKENYFRKIENLFTAAEVNELVALYSSLPLYAYPEIWTARCAEGIRNNIGDVLQAIMCNNPYPSENLNEAAWNQLVLKAIFTDKPMEEIIGLDERANESLAKTLVDYAHERWAAHRTFNPQLWRCVGPFINEQTLPDISKVLSSGTKVEKDAAALAIHSSNYAPAKKLLSEEYKTAMDKGLLTWKTYAEKQKDYVLQQ